MFLFRRRCSQDEDEWERTAAGAEDDGGGLGSSLGSLGSSGLGGLGGGPGVGGGAGTRRARSAATPAEAFRAMSLQEPRTLWGFAQALRQVRPWPHWGLQLTF